MNSGVLRRCQPCLYREKRKKGSVEGCPAACAVNGETIALCQRRLALTAQHERQRKVKLFSAWRAKQDFSVMLDCKSLLVAKLQFQSSHLPVTLIPLCRLSLSCPAVRSHYSVNPAQCDPSGGLTSWYHHRLPWHHKNYTDWLNLQLQLHKDIHSLPRKSHWTLDLNPHNSTKDVLLTHADRSSRRVTLQPDLVHQLINSLLCLGTEATARFNKKTTKKPPRENHLQDNHN